jgi:hypothetical protein
LDQAWNLAPQTRAILQNTLYLHSRLADCLAPTLARVEGWSGRRVLS